jgi:U3 small nucleolar RNA-associated protein 11
MKLNWGNRNAVQRKSHKERSQPAARTKWGLLEKHKDYVLRAQDFHRKNKALSVLKSKASFRNPDEFYFAMINAKTKKGVHIKERTETFDSDLIKLLKTQDKNYVQYAKSLNAKKLEKLTAGSLLDLPGDLLPGENEPSRKRKANHVLFVDSQEEGMLCWLLYPSNGCTSKEEKTVKNFDPVEHFGTTPELVNQPWNRLKRETLETLELPDLKEEDVKVRYLLLIFNLHFC